MGPPKRAIIHHQSRAGWVKKQTQYTEKGNTNWHAVRTLHWQDQASPSQCKELWCTSQSEAAWNKVPSLWYFTLRRGSSHIGQQCHVEIRDLYNTLAEHSFQQPQRGLHGGSWLAAACDPQHIGQSVRPETTLLQPTGLNQGCIPSLLKRYAATGQPDESCLGTWEITQQLASVSSTYSMVISGT